MRISRELRHFRRDFVENFQRIGMNTTPGDARFLRILVESSRARNGLEIGTANGYGAIVMGLGFERNRGRLTTIEIDAEMAATARANVKQMKLQETVAVMKGAALKVVAKLPGPFDFVFLDAWKDEYLGYLRAVEPKLKPRALIVADNVLRLADPMRDFLDAVRSDPKYQSVVVRASEEKHDGMIVIYRR
jgi:predicted O-methyltransferase YrrM